MAKILYSGQNQYETIPTASHKNEFNIMLRLGIFVDTPEMFRVLEISEKFIVKIAENVNNTITWS